MRFYRIYQLPTNSDKLFRGLSDIKHSVDLGDYCCVWADDIEAELKDDADRAGYCESLFEKFNCVRPKGFGGHSMSVSDVVMLYDGGDGDRIDFYYCDSIGFKKIEVFRK